MRLGVRKRDTGEKSKMMEKWNVGMMGVCAKTASPLKNPAFHFSIIPPFPYGSSEVK